MPAQGNSLYLTLNIVFFILWVYPAQHEVREAQGLLMTDRVPQWGWVKISQKKMGHQPTLKQR